MQDDGPFLFAVRVEIRQMQAGRNAPRRHVSPAELMYPQPNDRSCRPIRSTTPSSATGRPRFPQHHRKNEKPPAVQPTVMFG